MSNDDKTTEEDKTDESDSQSAINLGELRSLITDVVEKVVGGVKGGDKDKEGEKTVPAGTESRADRESSIAGEVQQALKQIEEAKAKEAREADTASTLADLKAKVEKPPVERRRVHKIMGWGEPD